MNLNELVKESHDRAKRKGFYDPVPTIEQRLCLIHSEVSEALEAHRERGLDSWLEGDKPCGFASELADVCIRIADLAGSMGHEFEHENIADMVRGVSFHDVFDGLAQIHYALSSAYASSESARIWRIEDALAYTVTLAKQLGVDIEEAIRLKSDANERRPHKHGNKAY